MFDAFASLLHLNISIVATQNATVFQTAHTHIHVQEQEQNDTRCQSPKCLWREAD